TVTSNAPWITISSGGGTVGYRVAPNTDPNPRSGGISVSGQDFTVNQAGGPHISGVSLDGKNLIVTGLNFDPGSLILVSGESVRTLHDSQNPNTIIGKKGIKLIPPGQAAPIQVQNSDGATSDSFSFMR
ncbi:MAG TPA: BACON domain-containing carbohydrate-binding protein, partial [Blastocatellia bacterium]|nr:BACON domain-containing carbohydrate-binding protein [Blastocatellia bacterium]